MCRNALAKFRQFLQQQRGQVEITYRPVGHERYIAGLPGWLVEQLDRYYHLMKSHWRPARIEQRSQPHWSAHTVVWRWLCERYVIASPLDVKRQYRRDYIDHGLVTGYAASTITMFRGSLASGANHRVPTTFRPFSRKRAAPFLKEP